MILDAIQEAEIDGSSERIKKRRRITESGVVDSNVAALVPRQVAKYVLFVYVTSFSFTNYALYIILQIYFIISIVTMIHYYVYCHDNFFNQ